MTAWWDELTPLRRMEVMATARGRAPVFTAAVDIAVTVLVHHAQTGSGEDEPTETTDRRVVTLLALAVVGAARQHGHTNLTRVNPYQVVEVLESDALAWHAAQQRPDGDRHQRGQIPAAWVEVIEATHEDYQEWTRVRDTARNAMIHYSEFDPDTLSVIGLTRQYGIRQGWSDSVYVSPFVDSTSTESA